MPAKLKARIALPKYDQGLLNKIKQGKPKFEALNNLDNSFEIIWVPSTQALVYSHPASGVFLYLNDDDNSES